jgi:DNA-binding LacI/PurR family transcriptional regulator
MAHQGLARRIVGTAPQITGLFVPSGYWTPYAYQALTSAGLVIGQDIDFICCDNVPLFMDQLTPRPAAIDINLELVGRRGVEQLLWRMANPQVQNRTRLVIEPVLMPGEIRPVWQGPSPLSSIERKQL